MSGADHRAAISISTSYRGYHRVTAVVRRELGNWFTAQGFRPEVVERARLIVSELATNAIDAAPGRPFVVALRMVGPGAAVVAVTNLSAGTRPPPPNAWGPAEPLAPRGRGLAIVAALADAVEVIEDDPATITMEVCITDQRAGSRPPLQQEGWQ